MRFLMPLLWPPASPPARGIGPPDDRHWWIATSALLTLPLAAIAHHAVFFSPTCMLQPFDASDYWELSSLASWLSQDPSLPWAIVMALSIYHVGKPHPAIKLLATSFFVSFLPLAIWIWDIPFTGRVVCEHAHDGKLELLGTTVRSGSFYLLGLFLFPCFFALALHKARQARNIAGN
jgi:hypothetical protein